jgi:hypothetical protein
MVTILSAMVSIFAFRVFAAVPRWSLSLFPFSISCPFCADSVVVGLSFRP